MRGVGAFLALIAIASTLTAQESGDREVLVRSDGSTFELPQSSSPIAASDDAIEEARDTPSPTDIDSDDFDLTVLNHRVKLAERNVLREWDGVAEAEFDDSPAEKIAHRMQRAEQLTTQARTLRKARDELALKLYRRSIGRGGERISKRFFPKDAEQTPVIVQETTKERPEGLTQSDDGEESSSELIRLRTENQALRELIRKKLSSLSNVSPAIEPSLPVE